MANILKDKSGRFTSYLKNIECLYCKTSFLPIGKRIKFCSKKCSVLNVTKNHVRQCVMCGIEFSAKSMKTRFCSHECYGKSLVKEKVLKIKEKKVYKRISVICEYCKNEFIIPTSRQKKARFCSLICRGKFFGGERSCHYKIDRTTLKVGDRRFEDYRSRVWAKEVKNRDKWVCRIADNNCDGKLEAHHILPWSEFPELRYQLNNGITLCQHHHPRKKVDVAKLSPYFQQLVASLD